VSTENIKLNPKLIEKKHYPVAVWVGYWSYYHERYMVEIQDKESKNVIAQTVVDC
jgi:vacuolar-type H+-ATPase catalytic subunit A/Vma1